MPSSRVTATNLSVHAHLQCDLYLHQSYHRGFPANTEGALTQNPEAHESPAAISLAAFTSGITWESTLLTYLDRLDLLLANSGPPLSGLEIASIVELDEREHFFVSGLTFWPPPEKLAEEYTKHGVEIGQVPRFGLAKPDLLEIWRKNDGGYVWRVIDAKASKDVKPSHLVQTYFYYLCLSLILPSSFVPDLTIAIWLPSDLSSSVLDSSGPLPSLATLHPVPIAPLVPPLTELIFLQLPDIFSTPHAEVSWHFNPLCSSCPFSSRCRARVEEENGLGKAGELSLNEAREIRGLMKLARGIPSPPNLSHDADIEDLIQDMHGLSVRGGGEKPVSELAQLRRLFQDNRSMNYMARKWPTTVKKVRRILALQQQEKSRASSPSKHRETAKLRSPIIEAALTNSPQFTNRQIYTLPSSEDIAIYFSFIIDLSRPTSVSSLSEFCVTTEISPSFVVIAQKYGYNPQRHLHGGIDRLIPSISKCIRNALDLHGRILSGKPNPLTGERADRATRSRDIDDLPRTQFYVWSAQERDILQRYLVNAALSLSNSRNPGVGDPELFHGEDIRLCIGALCEGASLLTTTFQPPVLDDALLSFLGKRENFSKEELKSIMVRLGVELNGIQTIDAMHQKITREVDRLRHYGEHCRTERRTVGLLPRIVVLKKELRRLVALPVSGWWDAKEAGQTLGVPSAIRCPTEEELFRRFWEGEATNLDSGMEARNNTCQELVKEIRHRMDRLSERSKLLVNRARVLTADWVDICRVEVLRKLFYMQQFEVLVKLQELWDTRMEGCPDAPRLVYLSTTTDSSGGDGVVKIDHFDLLPGNLEITPEHNRAFFNYILVKEDEEDDRVDESNGDSHLPLEALFDDLCVSGLVFPLDRKIYSKWEAYQATEVKEGSLWVAQIRDVSITNGKSRVVMRTWSGGGGKKKLLPGRTYRLSPRLVDFNTTKILSTLVELDLQANFTTPSSGTYSIPVFVDLISTPKSFGGHGSAVSFSRESRIKVVLDAEASLHRLYTELRDLGNENAGALVLKASQRKAARRILKERLTVIWGPPGSGKSYTIALSLLRMIEVQSRTHTLAQGHKQLIFVTAMTHAAIHACLSKLRKIIEYYRGVPDLPLAWLDELQLEHVSTGYSHSLPTLRNASKSPADGSSLMSKTWIYAGTVYQLYNFGKRLEQGVDCVVIDEAGQLGLSAASLVLRALSQSSGIWEGKLVVAGDKEQLAPIFLGKYPELGEGQSPLFGSVLDCLMESDEREDGLHSSGVTTPGDQSSGNVVQLLENFRLNPDLGNYVQTIYKCAFKPQKSQTKLLATRLRRLEGEASRDVVMEKGRNLLLSLASAMLRQRQSLFEPPIKNEFIQQQSLEPVAPGNRGIYADPTLNPRPISLALVRLHVQGDPLGEMAYECHVHTEAKVAAALVWLLKKTCDEGDAIFVACPHRIQRAAVNLALSQWDGPEEQQRNHDEENEELQQLMLKMGIEAEEGDGNERQKAVRGCAQQTSVPVTVDTIERLQGSEASFVICLFSYTHRGSLAAALPFLLARRRLNVAISRAKTLCIVISSEGVLRPGVSVFSDRESAKGYAYLQEFENRAWNAEIEVEMEA